MIATSPVFTASAAYGHWLASQLPFIPGRTIGIVGGTQTGKTTMAVRLAFDSVHTGAHVLLAGFKRQNEIIFQMWNNKEKIPPDRPRRLALEVMCPAGSIRARTATWQDLPHPYAVILDDFDNIPRQSPIDHGDPISDLSILHNDRAVLIVTVSPSDHLPYVLTDRIELEKRPNGTLFRVYRDGLHVAEQIFDGI